MPEQGKERGLLSRKDQKKTLKKGKSYLLGIGIDQYEAFPNLNNAVKDIKDFKAIVEERYELDEVILLVNQEATRQRIIRALDKLKKTTQPEDKVLIYYSGHGHLDTKKRGYWIPFDAKKDYTDQYVRNGTVRDYLQDIEARHILLISDSCFSGALFVRGAKRSTTVVAEELELRQSRWALCSGRHDEEVADGIPGTNSPFAKSILKELERNQQAYLNIAKLADLVVEQTRANYAQLPEGNPVYGVGHEGGQYIFRLKAGVAEAWAACEKLGTITAYQSFLAKYQDSSYADDAKAQIAFLKEETEWSRAKAANSIKAYYNYDRQYPNGRYSTLAWELIRELEEEEAWTKAQQRNTLSAYRQYMQAYPEGKYHKAAAAQIDQLIAGRAEHTHPSPPPKKKQEQPQAKPKPPKAKPISKQQAEKPSIPWRKMAIGLGFLVLLVLGIRGISSMLQSAGTADQENISPQDTLIKPSIVEEVDNQATNTLPTEEQPTTPPPSKPTLKHSFRGDELRVDIAEGTPPYTLQLLRNGKTQFKETVSKAGRKTIVLSEYRKDAGTYIIEVTDANGLEVTKSIQIDPPPKSEPTPSTSRSSTTVASKIMKDGRRWTTENINVNVTGSYCYDGKSSNCTKYGRFYTWEAAKNACKQLGGGWRLPTDVEWEKLAMAYGGLVKDWKNIKDPKAAYKSLMKRGNSGFAALLGGIRDSSGSYGDEGVNGYYWSSTEFDASYAWYYNFYDGKLIRFYSNKRIGFSCRCIQD